MAWDIGADECTGLTPQDAFITMAASSPSFSQTHTLAIQNAVVTLAAGNISWASTWDIGSDQFSSGYYTLTVQAAHLALAASSPTLIRGPWTIDFSGISQQILFKFEVWDGAEWQDLTSLGGINYLKKVSATLGGAGVDATPVSASWSTTIANDDGIFHPTHPTSLYSTLLRIGRKVRISVGRMHSGVPYYWQRMIGYMDAPKFNHGDRSVSLSGFDYSKSLTDTILRSPSNYWGSSQIFSTVATSETYGSELYAAADAMDIWSEANNESGWTVVGGTFTSVVETGGGSSYAAQLYKNTTYAVGYAYRTLALSLEAGKTYEVSFKYKRTGGVNCSLSCTISDTMSMMGRVRGLVANTWSTATFHFDATTSGNPIAKFQIDSQIGNADDFRIDQFSVREVTARLNTRYPLPAEANDVYFVTLDGTPIWYGDEARGWYFDKAARVVYFSDSLWATAGTDNLVVYYFTTQSMVDVLADILVAAGLYADSTAALAAMDYVDPAVYVNEVWFEAGTSALAAVQKICERCYYRFWFAADGTPTFLPAPSVGKVQYQFDFCDLQDISDYQDISQINNRVTIEGADQAAFQTTDGIATSKLKGEASDATSIAAYLESALSINNQLFDDQGAIDAMCATLLADRKDPKLYADIVTFANVVPLEVGQTVRWRVEFGAITVDVLGIIRSISISGSAITYKCEITSAAEGVATGTLVVDDAYVGLASGFLSLIPQTGVATMLAPANAALSLASSTPTLVPGAATEQSQEHDAMDTLAEAYSINPHWSAVNATIGPIDDTGGGSSYAGLILHDLVESASYAHSAHIADVVLGQTYTLVIHYQHAVSTNHSSCYLQLYQKVGANLMAVGTAHTLPYGAPWHTLTFAFTAILTGALQLRLSFDPASGEDGDELRVDGISVRTS